MSGHNIELFRLAKKRGLVFTVITAWSSAQNA